MKEYSISQIAKKYNLARSTLLYYESINLLIASKRSESNYRIFSKKDIDRLDKICELRKAGVSLKQIGEILESQNNIRKKLLTKRLHSINAEISTLRKQQKVIIELLGVKALTKSSRIVTKQQWISFLRKAGLDENARLQWHKEFEACSPEAHQDFLETLNLSSTEINNIRKMAGKKTKR